MTAAVPEQAVAPVPVGAGGVKALIVRVTGVVVALAAPEVITHYIVRHSGIGSCHQWRLAVVAPA